MSLCVYLHPRNMCQVYNFSFLCDTFFGVVVCNLYLPLGPPHHRRGGVSVWQFLLGVRPCCDCLRVVFPPETGHKTRIKRILCDFFSSSGYFQFANTTPTTVTLSCGNLYVSLDSRLPSFCSDHPIQRELPPSAYRSFSLFSFPTTHQSSRDILLRQALHAPDCRISCVSLLFLGQEEANNKTATTHGFAVSPVVFAHLWYLRGVRPAEDIL